MMVYLVWGAVAYESRSVLRVYADKAKADRWLAKVIRHQEKKPEWLTDVEIEPCEENNWSYGSRPATQEEQLERMAEINAWRAKHPSYGFDEYYLEEVTVIQ